MALYSGAQWRGPVPNVGGRMGSVRLGVIHIMQGSLTGCDGWFHNPSAQVSAHFGVGRDGTVYQWVDTAQVAWAEMAYNDVAISIEHEGYSGAPLTDAQVAADVKLIRWVSEVGEVPMVRGTPDGRGWVGHGELGVAGGNHPACPGPPILAQLGGMLALAARSGPAPAPSPAPGPRPAPNPAPAPRPPAWPGRYLRRPPDMTGDDVRTFQARMVVRGWNLGPGADGVYGPITERAVRAFQTEKRATVDGIVGPITWALAWTAPITP